MSDELKALSAWCEDRRSALTPVIRCRPDDQFLRGEMAMLVAFDRQIEYEARVTREGR